jgi:hypothetical protein
MWPTCTQPDDASVRSSGMTTAGSVPLPPPVLVGRTTSQSGSSSIARQTPNRAEPAALAGTGVAITTVAPISAAMLVMILVVLFIVVSPFGDDGSGA